MCAWAAARLRSHAARYCSEGQQRRPHKHRPALFVHKKIKYSSESFPYYLSRYFTGFATVPYDASRVELNRFALSTFQKPTIGTSFRSTSLRERRGNACRKSGHRLAPEASPAQCEESGMVLNIPGRRADFLFALRAFGGEKSEDPCAPRRRFFALTIMNSRFPFANSCWKPAVTV